MAAVLFVELPSANTEAAAGNRGGFFYMRSALMALKPATQGARFACSVPAHAAAKTRTRRAPRWRRYSRSASIPAFATSAVPHRLAE